MPATITVSTMTTFLQETARSIGRHYSLYDLHFNGTFMLEIGGTGDRKEILEGARRGRLYLRDLSHRLRVPG